MGRTLFDKIWEEHTVRDFPAGDALVYLDRIFLHERTGSIALKSLLESGRRVANARQAFATMDHVVDTYPGRSDRTLMPGGTRFIEALRETAMQTGIRLFDLGDSDQGITHIVAAEQGIALPGLTFVCPDSHTCTLGAMGCLAWGIGTSDCEHALATEMLRVKKPRQMRVRMDGAVPAGVTAKDIILALIAGHSAAGGAGHAVEFAGPAIDTMPMESRFTICNMAVEFAAFTGIIAPDETTLRYVHGRELAPRGKQWDQAAEYWHTLRTDAGVKFDREIHVDCNSLAPMVTWGTSPEQAVRIADPVPDVAAASDTASRQAIERALDYMGLEPGAPLEDLAVDAAFIGSCTNSRLSDLRQAAALLDGRRVAPGVKAICVPGSTRIKREAEAEGLDRVFKAAGFEWREAGCSLCFYAGGEGFLPGQRVISSTNRNFEGRQGPGVRTHLASPVTVAASAVAGRIATAARIEAG